MRRALLVAAMAVSLWPLGVVLLVLGSGDHASVSSPRPTIRDGGKPTSARPELEAIASRAKELNEDLADDELFAGEPRYDLAHRAREIEEELFRWRRQSSAKASRAEKKVARRLVALMQATAELTEYPSQKKLRAYNHSLRRFDFAIGGR